MRRHFIPNDAPLNGLAFEGTPIYTDVWNSTTKRYDIRLMADFTFVLPWRGIKVVVGQGFECDGASVPKRFWDSIGSPYASRFKLAALLHDALYAARRMPRTDCDHVFLEVMTRLKVAGWRRVVMWLAVVLGGWAPWRRHTLESVAAARRYVTVVSIPKQPDLFDDGGEVPASGVHGLEAHATTLDPVSTQSLNHQITKL